MVNVRGTRELVILDNHPHYLYEILDKSTLYHCEARKDYLKGHVVRARGQQVALGIPLDGIHLILQTNTDIN